MIYRGLVLSSVNPFFPYVLNSFWWHYYDKTPLYHFRESMGGSGSKAKCTTAVEVPRYEDCPPESTNIGDLVLSGRYKVASPETVEMMKQIQSPREGNKMYPDSEVKDIKQYIIEQEGLEIGQARRRALSQQWRFFLSCEPMQRGLDAGIILGSLSAFVAFRKPRNRIPLKIAFIFLGGFCVGMVSVPLMVVCADSYNSQRIRKLEQELFEKQRSEFYRR